MPHPLSTDGPLERVRDLIEHSPSDETLRDALDELAGEPWFPFLCPLFGPALYRRNPRVFRPLLTALLVEAQGGDDSGASQAWRGAEGGDLEAWLAEADTANDLEVFRLLYAWRSRCLTPEQRQAAWRKELLQRFAAAEERADRALVLAKMWTGAFLDETTAIGLYERDPETSRGFVRRHMPATSGQDGAYWAALSSSARLRQDEEFFFANYRKTVGG